MDIALPAPDGPSRRYRPVGSPSPLSKATPAFPHRLCRGACRRRSARVTDPWRAGGRLGRDAGVPPSSLGLGLKIAEAMDTSQRGMGLDWASAKELISRSLAEARDRRWRRPRLRRGHGPARPGRPSLDDVIAAYEEQFGASKAMAAVPS